jgi:hypothetical protein
MGGNRAGSFFSYFMLFVIIFFVSLLANTWVVPVGFALAIAVFWFLMHVFPSVKNQIDTNINLMLTMLIGGLWHGASWNFVTWGGLNGVGLVFYKYWKNISPWRDKSKWYNRAWGIFITFNFITFTRTWFRGESWDEAVLMLSQVFTNFQPQIIPEVAAAFDKVFFVMVLGYIIHWLPQTIKQRYKTWVIESSFATKVALSFLVMFFIYQILSADLQPFIYFAF